MSTKSKGLGLFSKLSRKSVSDLSEWNRNDERLMQCVETSDLKEIITLLKKKKVCSTKLDPQGHSALHVAAMRNKFDVVQLLIAYNANITAVDFQGRTALHCASRHGASEVLEVLTQSKEDEWPLDESKMSALHHACIGGNLDCVISLLRKYPKDIRAGDEDGRTPLFYAAQIGHHAVCKELLDRGASVNQQDRFRRTSLMCAAENGNKSVCELFVKSGANVDMFDECGRSAAWYAMDAGYTSVKQTIEPSEEEEITNLTVNDNNNPDYSTNERDHSPIPEESESVMGDDHHLSDTLSLRFRQAGSRLELSKLSDDEEDDTEIADVDLTLIGGAAADNDDSDFDDDFKASTLSGGSDDDGSISPRLSELSYTMSSHMKEESSIAHDSGITSLFGVSTRRRNSKTSSLSSSTSLESSQNKYRYPPVFSSQPPSSEPTPDSSFNEGGAKNKVQVTDLDADDTPTKSVDAQTHKNARPSLLDIFSDINNIEQESAADNKVTDLDVDSDTDRSGRYKVTGVHNHLKDESNKILETKTKSAMKQDDSFQAPPRKAHKTGNSKPKTTRTKQQQHQKADILMTSEGISLSTESELSEASEDETMSASISESTQSINSAKHRLSTGSTTPTVNSAENQNLAAAHTELKVEYDSLKSDYDDMKRRLSEFERSQRRQSEEEIQVTEHMDMVLQLSELSSRLNDEEERNRQLTAQISTLETTHDADAAAGAASSAADTEKQRDEDENSWPEDSDDEFGFPDINKHDDTRPVAKVKPRQMSLKEENREIAKLKQEIESIERQKYSLTEALTQLQSKFEDSDHSKKKLISDLDIARTTLEVKSQENSQLTSENSELRQGVMKYKDRSVTAVEQAKSYRREVEKLSRKLELYDREYRKVKERLKRKDANEKRMLKDRQAMMRKLDESVRRMREAEKSLDTHRQSDGEEADNLMVKCEGLETEIIFLKDFNEDQSYEIERLSEMSSCNEEMLELKQLEIQSLEKQITLLQDVSTAPHRSDSFKDTQLTIKSLQEEITKLQSQLAETAAQSEETIEVYRNHLIMSSKNQLDPDIREALQHILEIRLLC